MNLTAIADISPFLAVFVRAGAFLRSAPLVGDNNIPTRARVAAAALIAIAAAPVRPGLGFSELTNALPAELLFGLMAGFVARVVFAAAEAGGQLIGHQLELGFAAIFDPTVAEESLPTRRLARSLAGVAFLSADGLEAGVRLVATARVDASSLGQAMRGVLIHAPEVMHAALRITAPALVACLIAQLTVGLAAKAAPALNVFSVSLALVLVAGAIALLATAPVLSREIAMCGQRAAEVLGGLR